MRTYWALWLGLAATIAAAAAGAWTGLTRLIERWAHTYEHGWLVLAVSAWLAFRTLRSAHVARIGPSFTGLAAVAMTTLAYGLSEVLDVSLGMTMAIPLLLLAATAAVAGLSIAGVVAIPILLLYLAIPFWDLAIQPLQRITVSAVTFALGWYGPPIHVVGNLISIPAGSFEVAEGCSGMRYFMVSLAIAAVYGFLWYSRWRTRLLLLVIACLAAMLSNWIRVYSLILIGEASHMQHYLIAVSHVGYGWVMSALFLALVLWIAHVLRRNEAPGSDAEVSPRGAPRAAPAGRVLAAAILASVVLASPALLRARDGSVGTAPGTVELLGQSASGWAYVEPDSSWLPEFQSPYLAIREGFVSGDRARVELFLVRYLRQRPESKLISTHNRLHPGWQVSRTGTRITEIAGEPRRVLEQQLVAGNDRRLVWQWHVIGGRYSYDRMRAKLMEVPALLRGRRDGTLVALSSACSPDCASAAAVMSDFLRLIGTRLDFLANGGADAATVGPR